MKKTMLGLAVLLVFAIVFVGCPTDTKDNGGGGETPQPTKFEGTWKNSAGSQNTYKFTNNKWERTNNNNQSASGTFTFTDDKITFTPSSGSSWTQSYTLVETSLTLASDGSNAYGTFTKQ